MPADQDDQYEGDHIYHPDLETDIQTGTCGNQWEPVGIRSIHVNSVLPPRDEVFPPQSTDPNGYDLWVPDEEITDSTGSTGSTDAHLDRLVPTDATDYHKSLSERLAKLVSDVKRLGSKYARWRIPFDLARILQNHDKDLMSFESIAIGFFAEIGMDQFEGWAVLSTVWDKIRSPEGVGLWDDAVARGKSRPRAFRPHPGLPFLPLATAAWHLSQAMEGKPILLPVKRVAAAFDCSPQTASRAITALILAKVIVVVDGDWSYTDKKARTFRFTATLCSGGSSSPSRDECESIAI